MTGLVNVLLVALGGGFGAAARFLVSDAVNHRWRNRSPRKFSALGLGTIAVNLLGSLVIGLVSGWLTRRGGDAAALEPWRLLLAVGLCGGFTTFSTATIDSLDLARAGNRKLAVVNSLANLLLSLIAVWVGLHIMAGLFNR